MNSRKFYIYNIPKLAKTNVKKIGFFTFAFFLPLLFPGVAILTGAILQFFQHSIFAPAPYNPKTTQFRYKSQPQYINPKTNPNPNTIKNTLKLTQTILLANPKQLKTSPIHPPKTPHHTRCQTSPLTNM